MSIISIISHTTSPHTISHLCYQMAIKVIELDTPWQRNSIWKIENKTQLIDSILRGIHIPEIIFSKENKENKTIWE